MKNIVYFFSILLICCACSTVDCPLNNRVLARYAFKKADGTADTLRDSLTVRAIRMENDTLLLNRGIDLTAFDTCGRNKSRTYQQDKQSRRSSGT